MCEPTCNEECEICIFNCEDNNCSLDKESDNDNNDREDEEG